MFAVIFCDEFNHFNCFVHLFNACKLEFSVEVVTAGSEVRAGKSHEGKNTSVGAAADRIGNGLCAKFTDCFLCGFDKMPMVFDDYAHVFVIVTGFGNSGAFAVAAVDFLCGAFDIFNTIGEFVCVVVADDIIKVGVVASAFHSGKVIEAIIT